MYTMTASQWNPFSYILTRKRNICFEMLSGFPRKEMMAACPRVVAEIKGRHSGVGWNRVDRFKVSEITWVWRIKTHSQISGETLYDQCFMNSSMFQNHPGSLIKCSVGVLPIVSLAPAHCSAGNLPGAAAVPEITCYCKSHWTTAWDPSQFPKFLIRPQIDKLNHSLWGGVQAPEPGPCFEPLHVWPVHIF